MSIILQSSGGGSVTIAEPATASNFTQNLPAASGTVMVSGNQPAFSAYLAGSSQSVTSGVSTKAILDTKDFDTNNCFNNTGGTVTLNGLSVPSYSFCPNVAGYYQFNLGMRPAGTGGTLTQVIASIFKNNSEYYRFYEQAFTTAAGAYGPFTGSIMLYLNGTGDYVSFVALIGATSPSFNNSGSQYTTRMDGCLVRAA
jgi:hypothetical protein